MSLKRSTSFKIEGTGRKRKKSRTLTLISSPAPRKSPTLGFAPSVVVKLKYVDLKSYDAGQAASTFNTYRANSVFDPDLTGAGHQPHGFDQWSQFYGKWVVTHVKVTLRQLAVVTSNVIPSAIALVAHNETGDMPLEHGYTALAEQTNRSKILVVGTNSTDNGGKFVSYSMNLAKFLGRPLGDEDYGTTDGGPSAFTGISAVVTSIASNDPGSISISTELEYTVKFFDQKTLGSS